ANTTGDLNMASGRNALASNIDGLRNTANGLQALYSNTSGSDNTALGYNAGVSVDPDNANVTGGKNTFIGSNPGPGTAAELHNATGIGGDALVGKSDALVLGAAGVNVGVGTMSPRSLLQVGGPSAGYGAYLQVPLVTTGSPPPATDCDAHGVGRLV